MTSSSPTFVFEHQRRRLFGIAYRMLGSVQDAEDLVQEAFLRFQQADPAELRAPEGWLVTVVTRLSIDRLRRATSERQAYAGDWLPEPIGTADHAVEIVSDLSLGFLLLLERLAPDERAAFLLREVFEREYSEIGRALGRTPAAVRQMVHRARERVRSERQRVAVPAAAKEQLLVRFLSALRAGDEQGLLSLFADDAKFVSDSGGKVPAARNVLLGSGRIVRFLLGLERKWPNLRSHELESINGEPALVTYFEGRAHGVTCFDGDGARLLTGYRVLNPDKLRHISTPPRERFIAESGK